MFRPEAGANAAAPGRTLTLELAPTAGGPVRATVRPLTGADELAVAEQRAAAPALCAADLETLLLWTGLEDLSGSPPKPHAVEALLVGDRNRLLLALLAVSYGAPSVLLMPCEAADCDTQNEVPFDLAPILDSVPEGPAGQPVPLAAGFALRLPTGADLAAGGADAEDLLRRCAPDAPATAAALAAAEAEIAARDPCAEIVLAAACTECGAPISGHVDPLGLFVTEMSRCGGVLAEFDRIARAYHWSEAELRALPAFRRRRYLAALVETESSTLQRAS